jgi:hypothetical protein
MDSHPAAICRTTICFLPKATDFACAVFAFCGRFGWDSNWVEPFVVTAVRTVEADSFRFRCTVVQPVHF